MHVLQGLQDSAIQPAHLLGYGNDYWYQDDSAPGIELE